MNRIIAHFDRYKTRGPWSFCILLTLEALYVSVIVAAVTYPLSPIEREDICDMPIGMLAFMGILVLPWIETIVGQALPIGLVRWCGGSFRIQILASASLFAFLHFLSSKCIMTTLAGGVVGGLYLGFAYAHWVQKSRWTAFWVTGLSHVLHNSVVIGLLFVVEHIK